MGIRPHTNWHLWASKLCHFSLRRALHSNKQNGWCSVHESSLIAPEAYSYRQNKSLQRMFDRFLAGMKPKWNKNHTESSYPVGEILWAKAWSFLIAWTWVILCCDMAYWISPLTSCAWANESGLARVHEVNTTFFSTRATRMWCLTCSGWCHIFAHGPTADFSHRDHSGITGKNKFAFYVELAFVTSSPRNRFILLVKRKKIRLHWKFSEQIHYHMAQNYITMTCKILKSASAMRKTSHLPRIKDIFFSSS